MKIHVLGSAAGGGFPQWNCNCSNCYGIRSGKINASRRTQSSIAVSVDNEKWVLLNASPDIRTQFEQFPCIQPKKGLRDTGVAAVILVDSQIDHSSGLLTLREGCPIDVYSTEVVYQDLSTGFPILSMLEHWNGGMRWHQIELDTQPFEIEGVDRLRFTPVVLCGKAPPYSPHRHDPHPGDNIGLYIEDLELGTSLFYAPGLGVLEQHLDKYFTDSDCVLVDGTFWREDEMIDAGVGTVLAHEMGHLPQSGDSGMITYLRRFQKTRKILIHINNTNPILVENSPQRDILRDESIEVAYDGMEISLETQHSHLSRAV
ncbi:MAG: pyrroloquinoline quinone biosynthesis protein PqqB [Gammaproteobacteria bacterium]|nr:pyrroloquinoline quinone biosynthesis protein PqqB [Gammaproteobacteria bacterium]